MLDGVEVEDRKISRWLQALRQAYDVPAIKIDSVSDFPANSGLASSASGFAALALSISHALDLNLNTADLCDWARRGSASAGRSIQGGFVSLEPDGGACRAKKVLDETAWHLAIAVAVTTTRTKAIGSTNGMQMSQRTSPYYQAWTTATEQAFERGLAAVQNQDFSLLAEVSESSCRQMHALMLSTEPALIYWNGVTLACIDAIGEMQREGIAVFYTIDAGPHVKAVCTTDSLQVVKQNLASIEGVVDVLESKIGGSVRILDAD